MSAVTVQNRFKTGRSRDDDVHHIYRTHCASVALLFSKSPNPKRFAPGSSRLHKNTHITQIQNIYISCRVYPHKKRVWRASNNIIYISECERAGYRGRQSLKSYVCFEYAAPHNIRILPLVAYRLDAYASEYIVLESVSDCTHPQRILYSI